MRWRRSSKCAPSAVMRLRRCDVISSQCCGPLALLNIQFFPAWDRTQGSNKVHSIRESTYNQVCKMPSYRDGILSAGVYDGLQQVVKLCDVQLSFHKHFLDLLFHSQSNGCGHLFLYWERDREVNTLHVALFIEKKTPHQKPSTAKPLVVTSVPSVSTLWPCGSVPVSVCAYAAPAAAGSTDSVGWAHQMQG